MRKRSLIRRETNAGPVLIDSGSQSLHLTIKQEQISLSNVPATHVVEKVVLEEGLET